MSKRWINTSVEYQWSDELGKLVQLSKEGYWYEGDMTLCTSTTYYDNTHTNWNFAFRNTNGVQNQTLYIHDGMATYGEGSILAASAPTAITSSFFSCYNSTSGNARYVFNVKGDGKTMIGDGSQFPSTGVELLHCYGGTVEEDVATFSSQHVDSTYITIQNSGSGGRAWSLVSTATNYTTGVGFHIRDGATNRLTIDASGNCGINDTSPSYKLEVNGTFYSSGSSIEYKQDVELYTPPEGALMGLKPVQYQYKDAWKDFGKRYAGNSSKQLGFVAEDVAKILPELAVTKTEDGQEVVRNVDYEKLTVLLVSEVQSLRKEVNDLKRSGANNSRPSSTNTQSSNAITPS